MIILCPACSGKTEPVVIAIEEDERSCYCSHCGRRYWIETLTLTQSDEKRIDAEWSDYNIKGLNNAGRQVSEELTAQARLPLRQGGLITLVKRGRALVGFADQNNNTWINLKPRPQKTGPWRSLFPVTVAAALVISAAMIWQIVDKINLVADDYGLLPLAIIIAALIVILVAPIAAWLINTASPPDNKS